MTLGDRPVTNGSVSFRPDAAKGNPSQHHPAGVIDAEGNYRLFTAGKEGAPPGWYKVLVTVHEKIAQKPAEAHPGMPKSLINARYAAVETTDLSVEVVEEPAQGAYDLKLTK